MQFMGLWKIWHFKSLLWLFQRENFHTSNVCYGCSRGRTSTLQIFAIAVPAREFAFVVHAYVVYQQLLLRIRWCCGLSYIRYCHRLTKYLCAHPVNRKTTLSPDCIHCLCWHHWASHPLLPQFWNTYIVSYSFYIHINWESNSRAYRSYIFYIKINSDVNI